MKHLESKNKQELVKLNQSEELIKLDTTELNKVVGGEQCVCVESDAEIFGIF